MSSEYDLVALDDPNPWDQRRDESSNAFHTFTAYRNAGPKRKKGTTAREMGVTAGTISMWSADYDWSSRVQAWDYYQDRIFQAEIAESQRETARRHAKLSSDALTALRTPVRALLERMETDPDAVLAEFGAKDLMKLMRVAQDSIKIMPALMGAERLALGQPSEVTERNETHTVNYNDAQRIGEVLDVLKDAGVLDAFLASGGAGEIIDAEAVEMDDGGAVLETDSLPAPTP